MVVTPPSPSAYERSSTRIRRRNDRHDNSRDSSSLIYGADFLPHSFVDCHVWSLDRLKVNPKCRLIIFLENPGHSLFPTYSSTSHAKFTEISGMTIAKKGHIERLKFARTEINQHSGKT